MTVMVPLPFPGNAVVHGVFAAAGIAASVGIFIHELRRQGLTDERLWAIMGCALAFGAVGGRLGTWFGNPDASILDWWDEGNRSVLSGLLGAWIGVHIGKRLTGYRPSTGDLFAPAVALGMAIARIGCGLTELPGTPTGGGWGMTVTPEFAATFGGVPGVGLHPSLFYEAVFHAVAFALLWRWRGRLARPGDLFVSYVAVYALFRFLVEFVRGSAEFAFGLSGPQVFLLAMLPLLGWRMVRVVREARARAALAGEEATR